MLGYFIYSDPTKIKKNGIYEQVMELLKANISGLRNRPVRSFLWDVC